MEVRIDVTLDDGIGGGRVSTDDLNSVSDLTQDFIRKLNALHISPNKEPATASALITSHQRKDRIIHADSQESI